MRKFFGMIRYTIVFCLALLWFNEAQAQCLGVNNTSSDQLDSNVEVCGTLTVNYHADVYVPSLSPGSSSYSQLNQEWIITGGGFSGQDPLDYDIAVNWTGSGEIYNYITWVETRFSGQQVSKCAKSTVYSAIAYTVTSSPTTGSVCQDPGLTLTATTNMPNPSYQWFEGTFHGGTPSGTTSSITVNTVVTGAKYRVRVSTTEGAGCTLLSDFSTVTVTVNEVTNRYKVKIDTASYCQEQGVTVRLNGSDPGVTYYLYVGGIQWGSSDSSAPILWRNVKVQGNGKATVIGIKGSCSKQMDSDDTPTIQKLLGSAPGTFLVQGGGSFCASTGIGGALVENGKNIFLAGSEKTVIYSLKLGGATGPVVAVVDGTGRPLTFPAQPAGTYTVVADAGNAVVCATTMPNTVTVSVNSNVLTRHDLTGTNYCATDIGGSLTLLASTSGKTYQLYKESVPWGAPQLSTGSLITWDTVAAGGRYAVIATGTSTDCPTLMNNLVTIRKIQPQKFNLVAQGDACSPSATITLANSESGVTYQLKKDIDPPTQQKSGGSGPLTWTTSLNGKYTVIATTNDQGCTRQMNYVKVMRPTLSINVDQYPCTNHFGVTMNLGSCGVTGYDWDFGDATTHSTSPEPFHNYTTSGQKIIKLTVTSNCNGVTCTTTASDTITVDINSYTYPDKDINVYTDQRQKIINTSANTFSDAWQLPYELNYGSITNPYLTGERGVWRNEGQYVYKAARSQSTPVNIATDGTFTMHLFNWEQSKADAIPNWVKANTVTQYSPYSYELENKDVMDIYSAALYDYSGQLVTAQGSNMRNDEMAFSSFETPITGVSGNWVFGSDALQSRKTYPVVYGTRHMAIVRGKIAEFDAVSAVDVNAFFMDRISEYFFFLKGLNTNRIINDPIVCTKVYSNSDDYTVIVLNNPPTSGTWVGSITVRTSVAGTTATLDSLISHTGKRSIKITGATKYPQSQLALDSNKAYYISAWVAVGSSPGYAQPKLRDSLGINVIFKGKNGAPDSVYKIRAKGPIIEGWQQVQGRFRVPTSQPKIDIEFKPGNGLSDVAWYDDLRLHPDQGVMKSYVYDLKDYRLSAILDEQNFASLFYYDSEGNLFLTKKDTERGRKTISENSSHIKPTQP